MDPAALSDTALWEAAPSAGLVLGGGRVVRINRACRELLRTKELTEQDLIDRPDWDRLMFDDFNRARLRNLLEGRDSLVHLDFVTEAGKHLHLTARKTILGAGGDPVLLGLQDATEIRENTQAFQAGYDEFLKVTLELERALATIEEQTVTLQRQKDILENEMQIAHSVQSRLFNENFSRFRSMRVAGFYRAMLDLGGDMWEMYETDAAFMAVLGDVMGHGVAPALISIAAKALFKKSFEEQAYRPESLARVCERLNRELLDITRGEYYITICAIQIDPAGRMEFITNGHPPLLIVPENPALPWRALNTDQPMLGIFRSIQLYSNTVQLNPGDRVLLYTDCLVESPGRDGQVLAAEQLVELLRLKNNTPQDAIDALLEYFVRFVGSPDFEDDLTLICLEVPYAKRV